LHAALTPPPSLASFAVVSIQSGLSATSPAGNTTTPHYLANGVALWYTNCPEEASRTTASREIEMKPEQSCSTAAKASLRSRRRIAAALVTALLAWPASVVSGIQHQPASGKPAYDAARDLAIACDAAAGSLRLDLRACSDANRKPVQLAQYVSNVCYTPVGWCYLPQYAPIGTPCWCASPYGPVGGYVR
jgi:hypothetical protein